MPENPPPQIHWKNWTCNLDFQQYVITGAIAIRLVDALDGSPIAVATVNVLEVLLPKNQVLIKNWSENEGILEALEAAGIVRFTGQYVPCGYAQAHICELLVRPE